jgi:hypothetical protein
LNFDPLTLLLISTFATPDTKRGKMTGNNGEDRNSNGHADESGKPWMEPRVSGCNGYLNGEYCCYSSGPSTGLFEKGFHLAALASDTITALIASRGLIIGDYGGRLGLRHPCHGSEGI